MSALPSPVDDRLRNLPEPAYTRLFGAQAALDEVLAALSGPAADVVCLEGPAGIGKATLAHACALKLCNPAGPAFQDLAWEQLHPAVPPDLTQDRLLDRLALQLGYGELVKLKGAPKAAALQARLRHAPYLVIVDNLDAADDQLDLVKTLQGLANPTRFLLLASEGAGLAGTVRVRVAGLESAAGGAFLRYLATERGLAGLASADENTVQSLFTVSGGSPLALQILAGLASVKSPERLAVELLASARPPGPGLTWIFRMAWAALSPEARQLLVRLTVLPAAGGDASAVRALSPLPEDAHRTALEMLWRLALVERSPTQYRLHRLTRTFAQSEGASEVAERADDLSAAASAIGRYAVAALRGREAAPLTDADRGRWLDVLETCLAGGEASMVVADLALALHSQMVASGLWRLWADLVGRAVELARQRHADEVLGRLLVCRGELLALMGDPELAVLRWQEAARLLAGHEAEETLAWLECLWAKTSVQLGDRDRAGQRLASALARAERLGTPRLLAEVHHRLGDWHAKQSQGAEALAELEIARQYAVEARWPLKEAEIGQTLALVAFRTSDFVEARKRLEAALALLADDPAGVLPGHLTGNLGLVYVYLGQLDDARRELERSLALADRLGDESTVCSALSNLGLVAFEQGQWTIARARFLEALERADRMGNIEFRISQLGSLGMLAVHEGQPAFGLNRLHSALRIADELNRPADQAETAMWLGEAKALLGNLSEALEWSSRAMTIAENIGYRALFAQIRMRRGGYLRRSGRLAEARECLEAARTDAQPYSWDAHPVRILAELGRVALDSGLEAWPGPADEMATRVKDAADPRLHLVYHSLLAEAALARGDQAGFDAAMSAAINVARTSDNDWLRMLARELQASLQARLAQLAPAARREAQAWLATYRNAA